MATTQTGASDGDWTSSAGRPMWYGAVRAMRDETVCPMRDGAGARGGGLQTFEEHAELKSLPRRAGAAGPAPAGGVE